MSEKEIRPCPFCGSEVQDDPHTGENYPRKSPMGGWIIHCECCGASLSQFRKSGKGEISWNTRPIEDDLRNRIAELEEAQRWIPVSDRLPEDGVAVLVAFTENPKDIDILTAKYYKHYAGFGGLDNWWNIEEGWHTGNPTHWMPFPESPEVTE